MTETPRLPIALRPKPDENGRGFLRRLAEANGHRSLYTFSQALGLGGGFGPSSDARAWGRLAQAAGLTSVEVGTMRWTRSDQGRPRAGIVVAGTPTTLGFVSAMNTRLCIACFRDTGIQRAIWSLSIFVACPRHGTLLATECTCGRPLLGTTYGRVWECSCGVAARDLVESAAPAAAVRVARNIAARVGSTSGYVCSNDQQTPFDTLCAHDYMVLVHEIGIAAATPASDDLPLVKRYPHYRAGKAEIAPTLDVALARLEAATRIIDGWPDAYETLLAEIEGRNAKTDASTIEGAFATMIGRRLLSPARGIDGVPLAVLRQAIDRYWNDHRPTKLRQRKLATADPTARRLKALFGPRDFARALRAPQDELQRRILRRVFGNLSSDERALDDEGVLHLVRDRAVALHGAAMASLSSKAVKSLVEGRTYATRLSGWKHPRLIPADPVLQGLRFANRPAYDPGIVRSMLERLKVVARRVEQPGGLSPLISVGLKLRLRPWYTKTDLLLDVVDGRLPVYTTVSDPTLSDLLVNLDELYRLSSARAPAIPQAAEGFVRYDRANAVLAKRFGSEARLSQSDVRRLVRGGLVRSHIKATAAPGRRWLHKQCLLNLEDLADFTERRLSKDGLSTAEAAAFGRIDDIGPLLVRTKKAGLSAVRVQREFASKGIKTGDGSPWIIKRLRAAIAHAEEGGSVEALLTGQAFTNGAALAVQCCPASPRSEGAAPDRAAPSRAIS